MIAAAALAAATKVPAAALWTVKLTGAPAVAPIIASDRVYVALGSGVVVAHALKDGTESWRSDAAAELPLAADGERILTASSGGLVALNGDGSQAWRVPIEGLAAPPLAKDGWVIVPSATELLALRGSDGSMVWRIPSEGQHERAAIEGDSVYVPCVDGRVRSLELASGRERWTRRLGGAATEVLPFPDRVFVGSEDKYFYALDARDGEIAWRTRVGAPLRGRPASDGERVFVLAFDNGLRGYARGNGALLWSPRGVPFRPASGPVVMAGLVFVAGPTTEVRAFEAVTGKPENAIKLPQPLATLPAFAEPASGVVMAAITGNLTGQWTLALWGPAPAVAQPPK